MERWRMLDFILTLSEDFLHELSSHHRWCVISLADPCSLRLCPERIVCKPEPPHKSLQLAKKITPRNCGVHCDLLVVDFLGCLHLSPLGRSHIYRFAQWTSGEKFPSEYLRLLLRWAAPEESRIQRPRQKNQEVILCWLFFGRLILDIVDERRKTFFGFGIEQSGRWVIISWYANSSFSVSWR